MEEKAALLTNSAAGTSNKLGSWHIMTADNLWRQMSQPGPITLTELIFKTLKGTEIPDYNLYVETDGVEDLLEEKWP